MEKSTQPLVFIIPENTSLELNFQQYHFKEESAVFIPSDQYVDVAPSTSTIPVNNDESLNHRFLFSQVLTLGHVDSDEKIKSTSTKEILDYSSNKWRALNPFNTTEEELNLLFDANDWLEQHIEANFQFQDFRHFNKLQSLSKRSIELSAFQWKNHKLINKARKTLYDTGGSIKESAYLLGFKDPAYFCRFFRNHTSKSPGEFIETIEKKPRDKRIQNSFNDLLKQNVRAHHDVSYYAEKLNLTVKTLSRIIKRASGITPKQHISNELITQAKHQIKEGHSITSLTFELGFEEVSHFSNFFKSQTGIAPSHGYSKSTIN